MEEPRVEGEGRELPDRLACLGLAEGAGEDAAASERGARVLRQRKLAAPGTGKDVVRNRRVQAPPRKRPASDMSNAKEIEELYLNKKMKLNCQTLETIAEEGAEAVWGEGSVGGRKLKRRLTFHAGARLTKDKVRKRRTKIKKLLSNAFLGRSKIPMHVFLQTMQCLDLDNHSPDRD